MFKQCRKIKDDAVYAFTNFKKDILTGLGILTATLIGILGIAHGISLYTAFIAEGNYAEQISLIKENGVDSIEKALVAAETSIMKSDVWSIIMCVLLAINCAILLFHFFKDSQVWKKIIMVFLMIVAIPIAVAGKQWETIIASEIELSGKQLEIFLYLYREVGRDACMLIYVSVWLILISIVVMLLYSCHCRRSFVYFLRMLLLTFALVPLCVLLLENIILLGAGIAFLALFILVVCFLLWMLACALGNSSENSSGGGSGSNHAEKENATAKKQEYIKKKEFSGDIKFYRGKGGLGVFTPSDDCIYFDGNMHKHEYVCTVKEFETGKVQIFLNGKRLTCL